MANTGTDLTVTGANPPAVFDLSGLITLFLADQCNLSPRSLQAYGSRLRRFTAWSAVNGYAQPTREQIIHYKRDMETEGLAASSIAANLGAVRLFSAWSETRGFCRDVARGIRGPKAERGFRRHALTREQAIELLASIDRSTLVGKRDYAVLRLMIGTALRTIEVVRADVGDISQAGSEAKLFVHGKGRSGKDEFVVLTAETLRPLRQYLSARGLIKETDPLFASASCRNRAQRLSTRSISRIVKDRLRDIGIDDPRLSAHSLRHTSLTFALSGGASIQDAQLLGRHANISTTMIYAHNVNRWATAGERNVDAYLESEAM